MFGLRKKMNAKMLDLVQSLLPDSTQIEKEFDLGIDNAYLTEKALVCVDRRTSPVLEEITYLRYSNITSVTLCDHKGLKLYSFAVKVNYLGGEILLKSADNEQCKALVSDLINRIM